ncbi:unannotated protein [freshwater metagenome]|uniref:Unannotated protein n=1 Tax=freshwater metagenome TaxID=449393 RepID=A0A6J6MIC5_9ZZZZ|nr:hypothetical protein [Actinomycetota bacterium]
MLSFVIAGLAVGALYAMSAMALVVTYNASRVFNFAQGGMAFFLAYCFFFLSNPDTGLGWNSWLSAALVVLIAGPLLGLFLWWILLGKLGNLAPLTKVAVMIGLQVALVAVTTLIFGHEPVYLVYGPVGEPSVIFSIFDVNVSNEQFIIIITAAIVALGGYWVLNKTMAGLVTRGSVDSELMTVLTGTNPKFVIASTWAIGTAVAGLAGLMVLPKVGLSPGGFANLIAASMAGAVIGKFTNLWRAFFGALLLGVVQEVLVLYLPSDGLLGTALRPSLPFLFMVGAVLIYSRNKDVRADTQKVEVASVNNAYEVSLSHYLNIMRNPKGHWDRWVGYVVLVLVLVGIPVIFNDYWTGLIAVGFAYTVVFLSYRLVTGEAGIISLAQISFAGLGVIAAAYVVNNDTVFGAKGTVPILLAMLIGGVVAGVIGALVGMICLPLGPLYAAIVTFAFALLVDQAVYTRDEFSNYGSGLPFGRPTLFGMDFDTPKKYYWFAAVVMFIIMFILWSLRRSTTGLVFATIRASRVRAATLGFDIFIARLGVFALGAAVAGIGGTMVASFQLVAFPNGFIMVIGLVWFALAVAQGTSSMGGLAAGGMTLLLMPAIFSEFLPERLADLPVLLFGLVAINMVTDPIGINPNLRAIFRTLAIKISGGSVHEPAPSDDDNSKSNVPAGV